MVQHTKVTKTTGLGGSSTIKTHTQCYKFVFSAQQVTRFLKRHQVAGIGLVPISAQIAQIANRRGTIDRRVLSELMWKAAQIQQKLLVHCNI